MSDLTTIPSSQQENIVTSRPAIGQKCLIVGRAAKVHVRLAANPDRHYPLKTEFNRVKYDVPREAYYIGYRTVHEGITDIEVEFGDYGTVLSKSKTFTRKSSWCVWLFIANDKSSPFPVFPQDVVRIVTQQTTDASKQDGAK